MYKRQEFTNWFAWIFKCRILRIDTNLCDNGDNRCTHEATFAKLFTEDVYKRQTQDHITEKAVKEASMTVYPANSIAVVTRSGILKHTFPVAYVPFETTINQDIKMLVVNENILPRYAFHVLQGKGNDILVKTKKQGGTVDSLDFQKVLTYKVPVPSKDVQSKLVEVLDNFESICTDLNIGLPAEIDVYKRQLGNNQGNQQESRLN